MRTRSYIRSALAAALLIPAVGVSAQQSGRTDTAVPLLAPSRSAWIGIAFSCSSCGFRADPQGGLWFFTTPPEVYSVEPGSPAYNAGMRRGDVLTHVDDQPITSEAGGRRWAQLAPGDVVRLGYTRGGSVRSAMVRAGTTPGVAAVAVSQGALLSASDRRAVEAAVVARDTTARRTVQLAQRLLAEQSRQEQTLRDMEQRLRAVSAAPLAQDSQRQLVESYVAQQARLRSVQRQQIVELLQAHEAELRAMRAEASARTLVPLTSTQYSAGLEERLRYSGSIGGADVEVRSASPVTVTETTDEVLIRVGDTVVRLRRHRD